MRRGGWRRCAPGAFLAVPLGMRAGRRDRVGRRRAARRADRPLDRSRPQRRRRPGRPRSGARIHRPGPVPRRHADRRRRGLGRGRVEDQRRARIRPGRRPVPRLSRDRPARAGQGPRRRKTRSRRWPTPIRFASWSTRSRLRSTRSSGSPRSSKGSISDPRSCPIAIGPQEIVRQARLLLLAIDDLDFAAKIHSSAEAARGARTSPG